MTGLFISALLVGLVLSSAVIGWRAARRSSRPPPEDSIGLLGAQGVATSTFTREGHVMVKGELWKATSHRGIIEQGAAVQVVGYKPGLTLEVAPLQGH